MVPKHNGCFHSTSIDYMTTPSRVEWDDYDIKIIEAAKRADGLDPIKDMSEVKLSVWEMFLYSADDRLAQLPLSVRRMICVSLDPELSIDVRMKAQENVCHYFNDAGSNFGGRWEQCRPFFDPSDYASWFPDLAIQMRDVKYRQDFGNLPDVA